MRAVDSHALGRKFFLTMFVGLLGNCSPPAKNASDDALHAHLSGEPINTATSGARFVPIAPLNEDANLGASEGGVRGLIGGVRVITLSDGGVLAATDPLPQTPTETLDVPARMGGGFLFRIGQTLYRADSWLAPIHPIFTAPSNGISTILIGLDRIYVQLASGANLPIHPVTGAIEDLGTFPHGPFVTAFEALDGWRAAAIVDGRGVVVTEDAGATWTPISLPAPATSLTQFEGTLAATTVTVGKISLFEVPTDGRAARPLQPPVPTIEKPAPIAAGPFGSRPLVAAIEDGWPLMDGTAIVARDGAIGRVRMADGRLVEIARDAFPMNPSRCHPISLARDDARSAFGFVCGETRGKTEIYAFNSDLGKLVLLRHFDSPRVVVSSGNGAFFVHGTCASQPTEITPDQNIYCIRERDNTFREITVRGDVGAERIVVLSDSRIAIISPPQGNLTAARLTVLDHGVSTNYPIVFDPDPASGPDEVEENIALAQVLRNSTWLEGFEEIEKGKNEKPSELHGWVFGNGTAVGIRIALDPAHLGHARHGAFIRDLGSPVVSGSFGIGWGTRRGYETEDGGMTWRLIELPDPLAHTPIVESRRACGPLGCEFGGWLRVGWGIRETSEVHVPEAPVSAPPPVMTPLSLHCDLAVPPRPPIAAPPPPTHARDWVPFYNALAPKIGNDDAALGVASSAMFERGRSDGAAGSLAHFYSWGPRDLEWESKGHAVVRWLSPFESSTNAHSTAFGNIPSFIGDAFSPSILQPRMGVSVQPGGLVFSDDGRHALWSFQHPYSTYRYGGRTEAGVLVLDPDRGPTEIRKMEDGERITSIDGATYIRGRWYLAATSDPSTTIVWEVESGSARELTRLPRTNGQAAVRLARSADDRALGVVIDGQPNATRFTTAQRWVIPIALDSGAQNEPELLGPVDVGNGAKLCSSAAGGWILDMTWKNPLRIDFGNGVEIRASAALARVHFERGGACVERIASLDDVVPSQVKPRVSAGADVTLFSGVSRLLFHCSSESH